MKNEYTYIPIRQKFVKKTFRFCVIFGLFRKTAKGHKGRICAIRSYFFVLFRLEYYYMVELQNGPSSPDFIGIEILNVKNSSKKLCKKIKPQPKMLFIVLAARSIMSEVT